MTTDSSVFEISRAGSDTPIRITPLSDALGAEITGLDLTGPVTGADLELIQSAFLEHHLLCFRSQALTPADFSCVARYFGEPQLQLLRHQRVDEAPEVSILERKLEEVTNSDNWKWSINKEDPEVRKAREKRQEEFKARYK